MYTRKQITSLIYSIRFPIITYLIWRGIVIAYQILLQPILMTTPYSENLFNRLIYNWVYIWDGGHYNYIVEHGYSYPEQAFFPLWPLLTKAATLVIPNILISTHTVITLTSITAVILLFLLSKKLFSTEIAKITVITFLCYPTAFFLLANYSEALFLSLTIGSYLAFEYNRFFLSSALNLFSSATRLVGIANSTVFLFTKKLKYSQKGILMSISIAGLLLYMCYLAINFNNPLMFQTAQKHWCNKTNDPSVIEIRCNFQFPLLTLLDYKFLQRNPYNYIDALAGLLAIIMLVPLYRNVKKQYFWYTLINLLTPLSFGRLTSMTRYTLTLFPLFIVLGLLIKNKKHLLVYAIISGMIQLILITLFTGHIFVG